MTHPTKGNSDPDRNLRNQASLRMTVSSRFSPWETNLPFASKSPFCAGSADRAWSLCSCETCWGRRRAGLADVRCASWVRCYGWGARVARLPTSLSASYVLHRKDQGWCGQTQRCWCPAPCQLGLVSGAVGWRSWRCCGRTAGGGSCPGSKRAGARCRLSSSPPQGVGAPVAAAANTSQQSFQLGTEMWSPVHVLRGDGDSVGAVIPRAVVQAAGSQVQNVKLACTTRSKKWGTPTQLAQVQHIWDRKMKQHLRQPCQKICEAIFCSLSWNLFFWRSPHSVFSLRNWRRRERSGSNIWKSSSPCCVTSQIIVRSPFRAKHHVVVQYREGGWNVPCPLPLNTPPPPPTPFPYLNPPAPDPPQKIRRTRKNRWHYRQGTSHCICLEPCFLFSCVHGIPAKMSCVQSHPVISILPCIPAIVSQTSCLPSHPVTSHPVPYPSQTKEYGISAQMSSPTLFHCITLCLISQPGCPHVSVASKITSEWCSTVRWNTPSDQRPTRLRALSSPLPVSSSRIEAPIWRCVSTCLAHFLSKTKAKQHG